MSNFDDNRDYYETIGVRPDSSAQDIAQAYRQLARQYHPDANPGDADAAARFKEINAAYQTLADPAKRAEYDAERAGHAQRGVDSAPSTPPGEPALVYYGSVRLNSLSGKEIQSALDELRSALTEAVSETADELRGALSDFTGELDAIARTGGDVSRYRPRPIGTHAPSPKHGGRSKNKRR